MISYIIPFLNEEIHILKTINEVIHASKKLKINDFEIILIDDKSTDNSVLLINDYIKKNNFKNIFIFSNQRNLGYGGSIKVGILKAKKNNLMWLPGDNAYHADELSKIIKNCGEFDIVSSFFLNPNKRNSFRKNFTKLYTPFLNRIFGLNLPYYCGIILAKKEIPKNIRVTTNSHFFQVEFWVRSFFYKRNLSFKFEALDVRDNPNSAKSFKLNNSIKVIINFFKLLFISIIYKIYFKLFS